jgi:hypothetical protein
MTKTCKNKSHEKFVKYTGDLLKLWTSRDCSNINISNCNGQKFTNIRRNLTILDCQSDVSLDKYKCSRFSGKIVDHWSRQSNRSLSVWYLLTSCVVAPATPLWQFCCNPCHNYLKSWFHRFTIPIASEFSCCSFASADLTISIVFHLVKEIINYSSITFIMLHRTWVGLWPGNASFAYAKEVGRTVSARSTGSVW